MAAVIMAYPLCAPGNVNGCPDGIVGLDEASSEFSSVQIYPNPSSGRITVVSSNMQINILDGYDTMGNWFCQRKLMEKRNWILIYLMGLYLQYQIGHTFSFKKSNRSNSIVGSVH